MSNNNKEIIADIINDKDDNVSDNLTVNSAGVFAARYLLRDLETGQICETMDQLWNRISNHLALVDTLYDFYIKNTEFVNEYVDVPQTQDFKNNLNVHHLKHIHRLYYRISNHLTISFSEFYESVFLKENESLRRYSQKYKELMSSLRFLPNTPTIMNAGTENANLAACFTLDMKDNIFSIMKAVSEAVYIFKGAGGVGINFSNIRAKGDKVGNVPNAATGPLSYQSMINFNSNIIKQGGKRRGANMALLNSNHSDIEEFITLKTTPGVMENYNMSVAINNDFWTAFDNGSEYPLINPRNGQVMKTVTARYLFDLIADSAWKSAEPGMIYFHNTNRYNPLLPVLGEIDTCNPCSEKQMYPNNSCTLGSINLAEYVDDTRTFNYLKFREDVYTATRFLDNVVDINEYPTPEIEKESHKIRRIGLGYMGLAHALYKMRIPYNSKEGFEFIERISTLLTLYATEASIYLAKDRGAHYYWNDIKKDNVIKTSLDGYTENRLSLGVDNERVLDILFIHGIRNTWTTTIAPTGTISMAADTSNGIEPIYSLVSVKNTSIGRFYNTDKEFVKALEKEGIYSDELIDKVSKNHGSCKGIKEIPKWIQDVFVTAVDIHWLDHLMALAVAQRGISNSISKTLNVPEYATPDSFKLIYLFARYMGIKGVSIYRDNSRSLQVMDVATSSDIKDNEKKNPFDKHLKEIGVKGTKKDTVIETVPSSYSMKYIYDKVIPMMNPSIASYVTDILENNKILENEKLKVNTSLKCKLCGAGMIRQSHCTSCSVCSYGFCD